MPELEGQMSIFDLGLPSGRTCPERSAATKAQTSRQSSKPLRPSVKTTFQFLNLKNGIQGGGILGNGWSLAWRVYDAQYWGVPQRRKRVYLIADLGSERAGEILFERESVCGNTAEGRTAREGTAADAERSVGGSCEPVCLNFQGNKSGCGTTDDGTAFSLMAMHGHDVHVVADRVKCLNPWDSQTIRQYDANGVAPNINANTGGGGQAFQASGDRANPSISVGDVAYCVPANPMSDRCQAVCYGVDCRNAELDKEKTHTIQAKANGGISLNCTPSVIYRNSGYGDMVEGCGTLRASGGDAGGGTESIIVESICTTRERN